MLPPRRNRTGSNNGVARRSMAASTIIAGGFLQFDFDTCQARCGVNATRALNRSEDVSLNN
jgi:hypothetical protein